MASQATFVDIQNDVYDRIGALQAGTGAGFVDANVARRVKRFINRWNRKILSMQGMDPLRRVTLFQSSVANQPGYGIAIQTIRHMTEQTTTRPIWPKTIGWYRARFPAPLTFTGTPNWYVPLGLARIQTLPSVPCQLFAVSTAAGDTTQTVNVEAVRTNGYRATLSVVLTGLTPVTLSAAFTDIIDIQDFYLSAVAVGTVTLTQGSGGPELSRIPIGQTYQRFYRYALAPTPSEIIPYTIDGIADIGDLVNDTDEPFPNGDFHDLLVDGAVYEEWMTRGRGSDARTLRAEIELRIRRLRCTILEWNTGDDDTRARTFDETIQLPIL